MNIPNNMTIVDRVVERIKKQPLGDLITEEDLFDIVKEAIPKAFFEKRKTFDRFNNSTEYEPEMFTIMRELLKDSAKEAVDQWLTDNHEVVHGYWKKIMDETLLDYVQTLQSEQATRQIRNALSGWIHDVNQDRMRNGQPMLVL